MSNETDKDITFIKALAEILHASDLSEIEVGREYGEDKRIESPSVPRLGNCAGRGTCTDRGTDGGARTRRTPR